MSLEVLLAGSIGALFVFFLGVAREEWRSDRERRGLLRLLLSEIEHNGVVVRTISESGSSGLIGSPNVRLMKMQTWQDNQERAAQLFPDELFMELDAYYSLLATLLTLLRFRGIRDERAERWLRSVISEKLGEELPRMSDPWVKYADRITEAQAQARGRITAYLDRDIPSLGDRVVAAVVLWLKRQ